MRRRKSAKAATGDMVAIQLPLLEDYREVIVEMRSEDIGGALASILSEGLYTNPMHAVREYVQNAIDAGGRRVVIKLTSNSVIIHDDGMGMNYPELVQARQFGISRKDYVQQVGFRGIGIYSGFDLCDRLVITSQKRGEAKRYVLKFDFGRMKQQVFREQLDRSLPTTPLTTLISDNSSFSQEPGNPEEHWTTVVLEDVKPFHLEQLYNTQQLRDYILKTLPIDFSYEFEHKVAIDEQLQRLSGYRAAHVVIQADGKPDTLVAKPAIPGLRAPRMGFLENDKQERIAFYWACMNKDRGKISDDFGDFRGFTFKVKGFTVGDNLSLQRFFSPLGNQILYWWWAGEIYVIDPNVIPTADRDDFQSSPAQRILLTSVAKLLENLEDEAAKAQREGRATVVLERTNDLVVTVERAMEEKEAQDRLEQHRVLAQAHKDLKKQRSSLPQSQKEEADRVLEKAEKLQAVLRREMGQQALPAKKGRNSAKRKANESPALFPISGVEPKYVVTRSLAQIAEDSGWDLSEQCRRILTIIDSALSDVLARNSATHANLLSYIEDLLTDNNG